MSTPPSPSRRDAENQLERLGPVAALSTLGRAKPQLCGDDLYFGARLALLAGEPNQALDWLDLARAALHDEGATLLAYRTELGRINVLADLSRLQEGIEVASRLRADLAHFAHGPMADDDVALLRWLQAASAENLGATYGLVGQHASAVKALEEARLLYDSVGSPTDLARLRGNLGIELLETGSPHAALGELRWAHQRFSEDADEWLVHRCIVAESRSLVMMGDYGQALARLAESDRFIEDRGWSENPDALRAQLARGDVEVVLNLFPEVLENGQRLQPLFAERAMTRELAESLLQSAKALLGMRRSEEAGRLGNEAVALFKQAGLPIKAAYARAAIARCGGDRGGQAAIDEALAVLTATGELHAIATTALSGADLAPTDRDRRRYLEIAESADALANPETAWKALWHSSALAPSQLEANELLDRALKVIGSLRNSVATDHLRAPYLVDRRDPLESRLASHLRAGETERAFALSSSYRAAALSPAVTDGAPTRDELTLLYQSIGDRLVCFVQSPHDQGHSGDQVQVIDLGLVLSDVDDLMVDLEAQWSHLRDPRLRVHLDRFRVVAEKILQRLHLAIFAQVEPLLPEGALTIVPTGRLAAVPFAALHDGTSYLIDRRVISVAPGVPHASNVAPSTGKAVIVGVPDQRAPKIEREVKQIAIVADGKLLVGDEATVEATKDALADSSTLHLAGHSTFRQENPSMSAFAFADRSVTAAELCTWDLAGKTVVLASCSSGRQSNLGEDELQGLPRALLLAGAEQVVMNYWDVDDASTAGLMTLFHQSAANMAAAEALRSAQLATRQLFDHPYFWAAPVHYRNPTPQHALVEQDHS